MGTTLRDFAPLIVAMLAGGLGISLGSAYLARSPRGQARLVRTSGWALLVIAAVSIAVGVGGGYWMIRPIVESPADNPVLRSPARLFVLGLLIGLPLSLPAVVMAWSDARAEEKRRSKRKDSVPTKDDRRAYAHRLVGQILEASDRPRELKASIEEEGGRVLKLEGDIDAQEGERLTAALRQDLKELDFKRVKGGKGSKTWWTRV